jgi:hypothetical protein
VKVAEMLLEQEMSLGDDLASNLDFSGRAGLGTVAIF